MGITIIVCHTLDVDEAIARVKAHAEKLLQAFGDEITDVTTEWNGNILSCSFRTMGFIILVTIAVGESEVIVDANTPRIAFLVRNRIKRRIREELKTCLE
jgi:hypothetical protein